MRVSSSEQRVMKKEYENEQSSLNKYNELENSWCDKKVVKKITQKKKRSRNNNYAHLMFRNSFFFFSYELLSIFFFVYNKFE